MRASTLLVGAAALVELTAAIPNVGRIQKKWWWLTTDKDPSSSNDKDDISTQSHPSFHANSTGSVGLVTTDKDHLGLKSPAAYLPSVTSAIPEKDKTVTHPTTSATDYAGIPDKDKDKDKPKHSSSSSSGTHSTKVPASTISAVKTSPTLINTLDIPLTRTVTNTNLFSVTYSLEKPQGTSAPNTTDTVTSGPCTITYTVTVVPVPVSPPSNPPHISASHLGESGNATYPTSSTRALPIGDSKISTPTPLTTYGVSCDKDKHCKTVTVVIPPLSSVASSSSSPIPSIANTGSPSGPKFTAFPITSCNADKACTTITATIPFINTLTLNSVGSAGSSSPTPILPLTPQSTLVPVVACDKERGCTTITVTVPASVYRNPTPGDLGSSSSPSSQPIETTSERTISRPNRSAPDTRLASKPSVTAFPGYHVIPPMPKEGPTSTASSFINVTSALIPVWTAPLLGNAYGGGLISTPSIYVTPVPSASIPEIGIPPGYGLTFTQSQSLLAAGVSTPIASINTPIDVLTTPPQSLKDSLNGLSTSKTYVETTVVNTHIMSQTTYLVTTKYPAALPITSGIPLASHPSIVNPNSGIGSATNTGGVYFVGVTPVSGPSGGELRGVYSSAGLPPPGASPSLVAATSPASLAAVGSVPLVSSPAELASQTAGPSTAAGGSPLSILSSLLGLTSKPGSPLPATSAAISTSYIIGIITSPTGGSPATYTIPPYSQGPSIVALPPVGTSRSLTSEATQPVSPSEGALTSLYYFLTSALATSAEGEESLQTLTETSALAIPTSPAPLPIASLAPVASGRLISGAGGGGNGSLNLPLGPSALPAYEGNATAVSFSISLWLIVLAAAVVFL